MKVAVIPARGGSKRIPRKNIRLFCGEPIITRAIRVAVDAAEFDRVIVSTDDSEIAAVAAESGAEVPFTRPARLANDFTGTIDVIAHATSWMLDRGMKLESVCCIYPTNPFLRVEDLKDGMELLEGGDWQYVVSATEFSSTVYRAFRKATNGSLEMLFPSEFATRTQDLPTVLHDAAQFYWGRPQAWLEKQELFGSRSAAIMIPRWRVLDIDTEDDWRRAELLYRLMQESECRTHE